MKGKVKVDCDASIYGEMFIFIREKANRYFLNGRPNILRNRLKNKYIITNQMWASNAKDEFCASMFTEWQPGRVQQIYVP